MSDNPPMSKSPRILIVDDDRELRQLLSGFLARHGYRVDAAADGHAMARAMDVARFDLVVLDLMLPGDDGLALCRRLRATSNLPVIMLTALAEETDRIVGLEMGADDYVVKPFSPRELLARIKAVLRRTGGAPSHASDGAKTLVFDGWRLDLAKRELHSPEGVLMPLTSGEFDLLAAFAEHPQRVLSRDQLLDLTKGRIAGPYDRSIDVQLSRLRRKIEADPNDPTLIKTVRGGGYLFVPRVLREK
ncbi:MULTISPECIES: response regulator [Methylocaldum]|jgi:two-component system OmpR family response regulator|uniref:response regulator n=2 Tax=Methylocaldum TaxID=73778 RepID=UPI0010E74D9F|nr:response regulator [Methylocaldum sp. 14B]MBP1150604.1 two-component system OmpR family response regulator [Methylocaldum sp. RMAD-M]MDV3241969.1 response regulator [Methylocaldum sp.]